MMFSFGASAKAETVLVLVTLVVLFGGDGVAGQQAPWCSLVLLGGVAGLQAGNFAGITINRHFRGDIFHNEGETILFILRQQLRNRCCSQTFFSLSPSTD